MANHDGFSLDMRRIDDFEFRVSFDDPQLPELMVDEPEPIGRGAGPNAVRLLAVAVGNCLSASLLFCLKKSRGTSTNCASSADRRPVCRLLRPA